MTRLMRALAGLLLLAAVAACAPPSKFKSYNGPAVTQVVVQKGERRMYLLHGTQVLKAYDIGLGNQPIGHKMVEGDGRTPEGIYFLDRFNPNSRYHLSVGISYPDVEDSARAALMGMAPGNNIFIHGRGPEGNALVRQRRDWTAGCIAVSDKEIEDIYAMLRPGVPIVIHP